MLTDDALIWIDLEMTGLNPIEDVIIEIATLITDKHLNIIAEGPVIAIHQPNDVLESMNAWCQKQHGQSGLTARVQASNIKCSEAEQQTLNFLKNHVRENVSPMCGNNICQDRRFLARWMPTLETYFHYRNLDVSTIKELAKRWKPDLVKGLKKQSTHLAMDDIKDSIHELKYYKDHWLH